MDDDQQFCLRWNNHQSTLIAVFDTLLEKGVHVDCTLAAEGQTLKAHKVVLSACSPYFENVLSQQYDKHPIIILKDVKFAELKAMMDYMYRGEVNISQDQLAALLKAAESLQIKGLSDSKPPPPRASSPLIRGRIVDSAVSGQIHSREGSSSPLPRKRKKVRRSSLNDTDAEVLNNSDHIPSLNHMPSSVPVTPRPPAVEPSVENDIVAANKVLPAEANDIAVKVKNDISARDDIEPKGELICEDGTEDSVEDLTLDEEIDSETEHSGPGPSHPQGDCVQSFAWHMDRAQDESTPSMDGQRDSQVAKKYDVALAGILKRTMPLTRGSLRADKKEKYALKSITRKPRILLRPKAAAKQQEVIPSKGAVNSKTPNILVEILPTVSVVAKTTEILIEDAEITESLVKEPVTFEQTDIGKSCGKCSCALAKDSSTYTSDRNVDNSPSPEIAIKDSVITALKVEKSRRQAATKGRNIASTKVGKTESETKGSSPNFETLTRGRNSMLNKRLEKSPTAESPAADAKVTSLLIANFIKTESPNLPCAQYATDNGYKCPNCKRTYNARKNLVRHVNLECGREPQHKCAHCSHRTHRRNELKRHIQKKHTNVDSKSG